VPVDGGTLQQLDEAAAAIARRGRIARPLSAAVPETRWDGRVNAIAGRGLHFVRRVALLSPDGDYRAPCHARSARSGRFHQLPRSARLMAEKRIGAVAVKEGGKTIGLVTERELVYEVLASGGVCDQPIANRCAATSPHPRRHLRDRSART